MPSLLSPPRRVAFLAVSLALFVEQPARAEPSALPRLGLAAGEPQQPSAPPTTPFGRPPATSTDSVLDLHGFLLLPVNVGVLEREAPAPGQSGTTLHSPALLPEGARRFEHTGVVPSPWIQLNLSYGNRSISGTAILAARSASNAAGFFDAVDQIGLTDAFITVNLSDALGTPFSIQLGALTGRYGAMGASDAGRYATPLIARTNAIGEVTTLGFSRGDFGVVLEHGIGGQIAGSGGEVPGGWNDFADSGAAGSPSADAPAGVGASFVNHLHAGASYRGLAELGLHYLTAWTQDDRAAIGTIPEGRITVLGADARLNAGRGGHLYAGYAHTDAVNSAIVSGIIEILNARGGPELIREYLGPNSGGDGQLSSFGGQYDLSVARLLYGDYFEGDSPDIRLSLFGMLSSVDSADPAYDLTKAKFGVEASYEMLSWFATSLRVDHVRPALDDSDRAFSVISPRLLFHTDWRSRDEFMLQYSHYVTGDAVSVRTGFPPVDDPQASPDRHVFTLSGTFWW